MISAQSANSSGRDAVFCNIRFGQSQMNIIKLMPFMKSDGLNPSENPFFWMFFFFC